MGQRLILDSAILIEVERGRLRMDAVLAEEDDVVIAAITIAEYATGVALADTPAKRASRAAFLHELLQVTPVEDYTEVVAEQHAMLLGHVHRSGRPRGAHDLIIAATALATDRILVTTDARARFGELPNVAARLVTP
ncbi:type II toxin-antitoxin system VapC family toxin [Solihabitans fulvus]|uniref:Ribonuclease VapC n=1 Tax=Solihabitans fulvus TaxID=1892852 RepID=A0A5B2X088_9PSEU|nr:PIN domain-containing protein [Solihabitans fulvus]KAA2256720.1 type II toxin-antitoxin system VapC family toxin [Solihabitans fulvus]